MTHIEKLKELRNDRDIKQETLAQILNVQQSAISKYEKGTLQLKCQDLKKLCLFYNVSADYILDLPEHMPYPKRTP